MHVPLMKNLDMSTPRGMHMKDRNVGEKLVTLRNDIWVVVEFRNINQLVGNMKTQRKEHP